MIAHVLTVARRQRYPMLVAFVAALAGGWLVVGKRPVRYRADAYLVVAQALPPELSSREVPLVRDVIRATAARSLATQVAIMKTPAVMGRAYEDLPRRYHSLLQSGTAGSGPSISATALSEEAVRSDMIRVSVTWCDPEAAAALANAIARRHIRFTREFNRDIARSALPYLETELDSARRQVEDAELELLDRRAKTGLYDPDEQIRAKAAAAAATEKAAADAGLERVAAQAQLKELSAAVAREPVMQTSSQTEERNRLVDQMRSSVAEMKVRRAGLTADFSATSPEVRQVDSGIAAAQQVAAAEKPTVPATQGEALNAVREDLRRQAATVQAQIAAAAARERENRSLHERYIKELRDMTAARARLLQFDTTAEVLRDSYKLLRERSQSLSMRTQERLADVSMLAEAEPPQAQVAGPSRGLQILFIVFLALLISCGVGAGAELIGLQFGRQGA